MNSFFADYDGEKLAQLFFNAERPQSKVVKRFFNVRAFEQLRQLFSKEHEAGSDVSSSSLWRGTVSLLSIMRFFLALD
ncbi:hypothetical protein [Pseudomonas aeruginosa]|uniref:hypothetical protein n=1 Tax=Pseudomonas aeruginosa TaxID=287 RepID=UPI0011B034A2|nr:hypothetical protein [Pseudomonas aeruginosa]